MAAPGVSSLKMELGYGTYSPSDVTPADSFTKLGRINSISGIELSQESIDASAIEDDVSQYVAGRSDTGGDWPISVNVTDETITAWESLAGKTYWFEVYHPELTKAWFVVAKVPAKIPVPEVGQNELLVMEITLTVQTLYGTAAKVAPTV